MTHFGTPWEYRNPAKGFGDLCSASKLRAQIRCLWELPFRYHYFNNSIEFQMRVNKTSWKQTLMYAHLVMYKWWESSESNADWQCHKLLCYRYTTFPMHPRLSEASFAKPISAVRCLRGSGASNLPTTNNSFSPAIRLMSDASLWAELLITRRPITSPLPNRTAHWHQYGHITTLSSYTLKKLFRDNHSRCLVSAFENTLNIISQAHFTLNKKNTK